MADSARSDGFRSALIGGIIGAIGTAIAGGLIVLLTSAGSAVTDYVAGKIAASTLKHLKIELREGSTSNKSDFSAACLSGELVVGGQCFITDEEGALQNAGSTPNGGYSCTYSRRADPKGVKARIQAACLALK
jgi:hypothetical protein